MHGSTYCCNKVVVTTNGLSAVCSEQNHNLKNISPCDHEEADTKILLHLRDALLNGSHMKQDHNFDILQLIKLQDNLDQNMICYSSSISCFDRFGHHVCVLWPWEEKCMGCLTTVPNTRFNLLKTLL